MDGQKATGNDSIPPKLLKANAHYLCNTITFIVNKCTIDSIFPDDLKLADVIPLLKKMICLINKSTGQLVYCHVYQKHSRGY